MNDPYVPTNRGWRRKIGPASKYRFNMPQEEAPSRFSRGDLRGSGRETNFQVSLREARELSEANAAIERREKQRTNQAKRAEEAKKSTAAPSIAEKNAASVAAFGSGKAPAATQAAPAAPVMSREERNKIEEERRAKGRAKAEAERPGSLKAKLEEARSPAMRDDMTDAERKRNNERHDRQIANLRLKRQKELDSAKLTNAKWKAEKEARLTGQEPKASYSSPTKEPAKAPVKPVVHVSKLFTDRAPKPAAPTPSSAPRPSDSYVSGPGRKSIMTGKTSEQEKAEAERAKKKAAAEKLFRTPRNAYRPAVRF